MSMNFGQNGSGLHNGCRKSKKTRLTAYAHGVIEGAKGTPKGYIPSNGLPIIQVRFLPQLASLFATSDQKFLLVR